MKGRKVLLLLPIVAIAVLGLLMFHAATATANNADYYQKDAITSDDIAETPGVAPAGLQGVPDPGSRSGQLARVVVTNSENTYRQRELERRQQRPFGTRLLCFTSAGGGMENSG